MDVTATKALFSKQKIHFKPPSPITHLVCANNSMYLVLENGRVIFIPLQDPTRERNTDIGLVAGDRITNAHLDPTGHHLVLSSATGDNFYFHSSFDKPKPLLKFKGQVITAIGWNADRVTDNSSSFILVGNSRGHLHEAELNSVSICTYFKQVFTFTDNVSDAPKPLPICGIEMHRSISDPSRWFVLVATPSTLNPFVGSLPSSTTEIPVLGSLFQLNTDNPGRSHNLPGNMASSQLFVDPEGLSEPPEHYAWIAGAGIKYGDLDSSQSADAFKIFTGEKYYKYPSIDGRAMVPVCGALSQYHILLLFPDRFLAVCTLNQQIVYQDINKDAEGKLLGLYRDPISGMVWVHTDRAVYKYTMLNEGAHVWPIFLAQGNFTAASKCAAHDPSGLDKVLREQGRKLIAEKQYSKAAEIYAASQAPIEEVSVYLIQAEQRGALKKYLEKKLDMVPLEEKTQFAMLILWLLELYLTELSEAKSGQDPASRSQDAPGIEIKGFDPHSYKILREQFGFFLKKPLIWDCIEMNYEAVRKIMTNHGDIDSLLYIAEMMKDYENVILLYLQDEHFDEALKIITKQEDVPTKARLLYRFSPQLLSGVPKRLVDAWITMGYNLNPKRLLPAMSNAIHDGPQSKECLRYLEFVTQQINSGDKAVHHFLISLYAKFFPTKLLEYVEKQGKDVSRISYDPMFVLRTLLQSGLDRPAVSIYNLLGMHEEAVDLALKIDVNLAKQFASSAEINVDVKKKLWLKIARFVVEKSKNLQESMELLHDSEDVLKIQDLLPFFPEFATIEHFKEALCDCLAEHSSRLRTLQEDMQEATSAAENIKRKAKEFKTKYSLLKVQEKCSSCCHPLMIRTFYSFPCRHKFHANCLEREISPYIPLEILQRLKELKLQLASAAAKIPDASQDDSSSVGSKTLQSVEKNLQDVDEILAAQCPFCGDYFIRIIDQPFFTPNEYLKELKTWE